MRNFFKSIFSVLQLIGKALWLPIAVLPIAGLLLRLGQPDVFDVPIIAEAGKSIFSNLALLFAIGIAGGIAKDNNVSAGLSGAVSYFVISSVMIVINKENDMGVLGGVIAGLLGGYMYNSFYKTKLPIYLAFFGGKRFVPIVTGGISVIFGIIFGYIWPPIHNVIESGATWVASSGGLGLFIYGFLNRILVPTGLQHILEALAYFVQGSYHTVDGTVVTGDLNRFYAGDKTAGMFMSGFFPVMIFGLPAAALAIYQLAKPQKKKIVLALLLSAALTSLLTGVTEPIEFPILFSAPLLYLVHSLFMGLSYTVANLVGYKAGFTFSGGIIDLALSWGISTKPWMIFILGPIFALLYYFSFYFLIKTLNLKTPGREVDIVNESKSTIVKANSYDEKARYYIVALGGLANLEVIDNCITRLRLKVKDINLVDEEKIKQLGSPGVVKLKDSVQVVIGADVEFLADAMRSVLPNEDLSKYNIM